MALGGLVLLGKPVVTDVTDSNVLHMFIGFYLWEHVTSLSFDWSYVSGKRRFRWPMIFYFAGRYLLLGLVIAVLVAANAKSDISCGAVISFVSIVGNITIGLASNSLALRAVAVWRECHYIVGGVITLAIGQWALIILNGLTSSAFVPGACERAKRDYTLTIVASIYSMVFDLVVMSLVTIRVAFPRDRRTHLLNKLYHDGMMYFVVAFLATCASTVSGMLGLTPVLETIFFLPATIVVTVAANRAVRGLTSFFGVWSSNGGPGEVRTDRMRSLVFNHSSPPQVTITTDISVDVDPESHQGKVEQDSSEEGSYNLPALTYRERLRENRCS